MTRTLKLALAVSLAIHATVLAVVCVVASGESKLRREQPEPMVIVLVPVQEDFIAKPVEESRPTEPPPKAQPAPMPPPPVIAARPEPEKPVTPPSVPAVEPPAPKPLVVERALQPLNPPAVTNTAVAPAPPVPIAIAPRPAPLGEKPALSASSQPVLITGRVKYRKAADPEYPPLARKRRQEGTVILEVTIAPGGRPLAVTVKQSANFPALDQAAIAAVRLWEFDVATDVPIRAEIPIRFELVK